MTGRGLAFLAGGLFVAACGQSTNTTFLQDLQRPTDVTFGCFQLLSPLDGGVAETTTSPANCGNGMPIQGGNPDAAVTDGDAGVSGLPHRIDAIVLEQVRSVVWVVQLNNASSGTPLNTLVDSDPFAPGENPLPVGPLPVGVVTSPDGCFAATANAGSCDLSMINIVNADHARSDAVSRLAVTTAAGPFLAKPAAILGQASIQGGEPDVDTTTHCQSPTGSIYVAYPDCGLVARIDLATGIIADGVQFHDGAPPTVVQGDSITCPAECALNGGGTTVVTPPPTLLQPSVLAMEHDGSQLYVGAGNSPNITIVPLGSSGEPTAVQTVALAGSQGTRRISASGDVLMNQAGIHRWLYTVDGDASIHVVEVTPSKSPVECDTQIDRRFLHSVPKGQENRLTCFPVGSPANPPRRADAIGPGVRLPTGVQPLDVSFFTIPTTVFAVGGIEPLDFYGTFAVVSASGPEDDPTFGRGVLFYINVADLNFPATEDGTDGSGIADQAPLGDPANHDIGLAVPHSLRDALTSRWTPSAGDCFSTTTTLPDDEGAPRISGAPVRPTTYIYNDSGAPAGSPFAPSLHRVSCGSTLSSWELDFGAPAAVRAPLFPDFEKTGVRTSILQSTTDEGILVTWQGPLAGTALDSEKSGAQVVVDQGGLTVNSPGALLCDLGVRRSDLLALLGCTADTECGLGEVCVIHPDAPANTTGMCLPSAQRDDLISSCKEILISKREYTVLEAGNDHTIVVPRPDVLIGSPIDGCSSDTQCTEIDEILHPLAPGVTADPFTFSCASDAAYGGPPRCIYTCTSDASCQAGSTCDSASGHCVLGPVDVPAVCLAPAQRFEYRSGDAFSFISSQDEYGSPEVVDSSTGLCVEDLSASPLVVQRVHRLEPPCTDVSVTGLGPNPCTLDGLTEPVPSANGESFDQRPAYGIRVRSKGITIDLTDIAIPLPNPLGLPELANVRYSPIADDYNIRFVIAGGFAPFFAGLDAAVPQRIRIGPDATLFVIDSGVNSGLFRDGQVIPVELGTVDATNAIY